MRSARARQVEKVAEGAPQVVFRVEAQRYALPLQAVREVVVMPEACTRIPRAPKEVRGVINLRGRVVTVVELKPLLGLGPPLSPAPQLLL